MSHSPADSRPSMTQIPSESGGGKSFFIYRDRDRVSQTASLLH